MQALECRVPPLAQLVIVAVVMWLLARAFPEAHFALIPGGVGIFFVVVGVVVSLLGVWEFRKARTTVDPRTPNKSERLVVHGVYHVSRNPMYVGFFIILLGWGVYLGHFFSVGLLPAFVAYMNRFQILPEERHMLEKFGSDFSEYAAKVRRWI